MTPQTSTLSPLAQAMLLAIDSSRTTKIDLVVLRDTALAADLSLAGSPELRDRLAEACSELEQAGAVVQPKASGLWDRSARPPLPLHVRRITARPTAVDVGPVAAAPAWHALLSWVPAFLATQRATTAELAVLQGTQRILTRHGGPPPLTVPLRERSLELLGDEKALDSLLRGRLFTTGRLTLGLIGAERVVPALVASDIGPGPDVLLVENYATFVTLSRALAGQRLIGRVVWGAGNQVTQLLPQFPTVGPNRVLYFGDLDARGLEIGAAASASAMELGLAPLHPSIDLYELLLLHGHRAPVGGRAPSRARVQEAVKWLPESLRAPASVVLNGGLRLAQEAVGRDVLELHPLPSQLN